jgi:CMP-N-acetylneuraminic acid synthetase
MADGPPGNMEVIAFIPVRGGSKSIPLKNIKLFCGEPLMNWSIKALLGFRKISRIYVATDSPEIADIAIGFHDERIKVYHRSAENAQDTSSTESVMLEFIEKENISDDAVMVLVQVTCPLTQTIDFENAYQKYVNGQYDSLLSVARIKRFLWNENGIPINYDYRHRPRRQDFEGVLMENGAFYLNTVRNIKTFGNRLSGKIATYEMPEFTAIDIDEPEDWIIAENSMRKHLLGKA